jgi:hypothetical protein
MPCDAMARMRCAICSIHITFMFLIAERRTLRVVPQKLEADHFLSISRIQ